MNSKMAVQIITALSLTLMMVVAPGTSQAQATITTSGTTEVQALTKGSMTRYKVSWTSNADGEVLIKGFRPHGYLRRVTVMSTAGADSPTNAYDVSLTDDVGANLFATVDMVDTTSVDWGADIGSSAGSIVTFTFVPCIFMTSSGSPRLYQVAGDLNLKVLSAGSGKKGVIALYFDSFDLL